MVRQAGVQRIFQLIRGTAINKGFEPVFMEILSVTRVLDGMEQGNDLAAGDLASSPIDNTSARRFSGVSIGVVVAFFGLVTLLWDFSEVLFATSRREQALELLTPSMRITQAERTLNSAGYLTLYIDQSPPYLQVSTLSDSPFTAQVIHRLFPGSLPDTWLREQLTASTRFYVKADANGAVRYTPDGLVDYALAPPPNVRADLML